MTTIIKNSASMFNSLIRCQDQLSALPDIALALEEFGLGVPQSNRLLDNGFGYVPIVGNEAYSSLSSYSTDAIEISPGQARYNEVLITPTGTLISTPSDSLGGIALQNVYGFGSIYMTPPNNYNPTGAPILITTLATGSGQGSPPLLMIRDVNSDVIQQWLLSDTTPAGCPPTGTCLELIRFVLDIDAYISVGNPNNAIKTYVRDLRRIRGFGGFSDETMFTVLVPSLIDYFNNANSNISTIQAAILNAVQTWIGLSDWNPDFVTFWNSDGTLPPRLKQYIQTELGLPLI